jgi:hypothetical protein
MFYMEVSGSLEGKYNLSDYNTTVKAAWSTANVLSTNFEFQVSKHVDAKCTHYFENNKKISLGITCTLCSLKRQ